MRPIGINWNNRLNRGLDHWWKVLPQFSDAATMRDIVGGLYLTCEAAASIVRARPHSGSFGSVQVTDSSTGQAEHTSKDFITTADYTVCFWAREVDSPDTSHDGLLEVSASGSDHLQVLWNTNYNGIYFAYKNADTDRNLYPDTAITTTDWHSYALTRKAGSGTLYVDGKPQSTSTGFGFTDGAITGIQIGLCFSATYTGSGEVDDLRLYLSRALSAGEILKWHRESQLYRSPLLRWSPIWFPNVSAAPAGSNPKNPFGLALEGPMSRGVL